MMRNTAWAFAGVMLASGWMLAQVATKPAPVSAPALQLGSHRDTAGELVVNAKFMGAPITAHKTRLLEDVKEIAPAEAKLDRFGGWVGQSYEAKGFFYARKVDGRWWIIDPEGNRYLHMAVVAVSPGASPQMKRAFPEKFGTKENWRDKTQQMLAELGFNGTGAWSDDTLLQSGAARCSYTPILNVMSSYAKQRGIAKAEPGHTGFPNRCIPIFDPEFADWADKTAQRCAALKEDPWLLGWFSDNELPFPKDAIVKYLELPEMDNGRRFAEAWLEERGLSRDGITEKTRTEFAALVMDTYLSIVRSAIRKYDPNHMYLGPRFYSEERGSASAMGVAGKYLDVIGVNIYGNWDPGYEAARIEGYSGRPIIVTEWYAKAVDSGLANTGGAGWLVATQNDRAAFYENFTLSLLELKACVGWHWFKYIDNDPEDLKAELSNRDSNKGMMKTNYEPYALVLESMKRINRAAYALTQHFDAKKN